MASAGRRFGWKARLAFGLALAGGVLAVAGWWAGRIGWQSVTVPLDPGHSLRFSCRPSHPFLAEYRRKVTILQTGRRTITLDYPQDAGGGFPIVIRDYDQGDRRLVRLTDALYDRLIDLNAGEFVPDQTPPEGKEFSSFVNEADLPTPRTTIRIGRGLEVLPP